MKYKIIEVNENDHQIVVRFYSDTISEESLAASFHDSGELIGQIMRRPDGTPMRCRTDVAITLWDAPATTEMIQKRIAEVAPYSLFKIWEAVANPAIDTSLAAANSTLNQEFELPPAVVAVDVPNIHYVRTIEEIQ